MRPSSSLNSNASVSTSLRQHYKNHIKSQLECFRVDITSTTLHIHGKSKGLLSCSLNSWFLLPHLVSTPDFRGGRSLVDMDKFEFFLMRIVILWQLRGDKIVYFYLTVYCQINRVLWGYGSNCVLLAIHFHIEFFLMCIVILLHLWKLNCDRRF